MQLVQLLFVFAILIARSLSELRIELETPSKLAELEGAAIQILTTCYANQTKTIALAGDYSSRFLNSLSAHESFATVLFNYRSRSKNAIESVYDLDEYRKYKVDVLVAMVPYHNRFKRVLLDFWFSLYDNPMALTLLLVWSPHEKDAGCDGKYKTAMFFNYTNTNNHLNTVLMCHHRTNGIMMYSSNPFKNQAPEPWQSVPWRKPVEGRNFFYFVRKYRGNEEMCNNLEFDKTRDLNGWTIKLAWMVKVVRNKNEIKMAWHSNRNIRLDQQHSFAGINGFISYVNASMTVTDVEDGDNTIDEWDKFAVYYHAIRAMVLPEYKPHYHTYPDRRIRTFLVSQFRGNKSQLSKILGVIDDYSWVGMFFVYLITLIFFKYFLRQSLLVGMLNLCRLTCNCGLTTLPRNVASQIYLCCLLFFVVTMQGIFTGNLASLLTHDFPVRQVNSIGDVIDLNYTVYCEIADVILFADPRFKGRIVVKPDDSDCIDNVKVDARGVCVAFTAEDKYNALKYNLHVSTENIDEEWACHLVPFRWSLLERFNAYQGIVISTGTLLPFQTMVDKKRLLELEAIEIELEPEVMTFQDVRFAFIILGTGLILATITLIGEITIHWYYRRVTTTRVIVLKR